MADTNSNTSKGFSDILYDEITSVIGGDNPNQFFCMTLPGMMLEENQYSYDIENNEPKPTFVATNESKLVDKLFDATFMTGSDNGRRLSTQYRTALNALTPKLNGKLFDAKTQLRKVLMTPYPYNFEDGSREVLTLKQVFFKLYNEYVLVKQAWSKKQSDKKEELEKLYPSDSRADYRKRNNKFLEWYSNVAETEMLAVEEKLGKVLGVFSPGDMSIITGILDSGAGREIAEARSVLSNIGKLNPDGSSFYPVNLYPENWFKLLDTSFTAVDLLESPAALAQQLSVLVAQRSKITANINTFLETIPDNETIAELKKDCENADKAFNEAFSELSKHNVNVSTDMLKTFVDIAASRMTPAMQNNPKAIAEAVPANVTGRIFGIEPKKINEVLGKLSDGIVKGLEAQDNVVKKNQELTNAALNHFKAQNLKQLETMLSPLKQQLEETNREIAELKSKIALSSSVQDIADAKAKTAIEIAGDEAAAKAIAENKSAEDVEKAREKAKEDKRQAIVDEAKVAGEEAKTALGEGKSAEEQEAAYEAAYAAAFAKANGEKSDESDVAPNRVPENFMQVIITSKLSSVSQESSKKDSSTASKVGTSFFFGGYSRSASNTSSVSSELSENADMSIQIGMSVAKVVVGREWFNPGLFLLTSDMYNTSSSLIAPAGGDYNEFDKDRFNAMNKCLFPCFPTSFVIARDVTIKFSSSEAISSSFAESVESHASQGGGFFIFSGSSSSSSSASKSCAKATSSSKAVTVRFTNPQIIGYYLEATPADRSAILSSDTSQSNNDFISIFQFIDALQVMLTDHNQMYNKENLKLD